MPEEKFHAKFGKDFCLELIQAGRGARGAGCDRSLLPDHPGVLRREPVEEQRDVPQVGLKQRTNDEMRQDFLGRVTELVEKDFGLRLPAIRA